MWSTNEREKSKFNSYEKDFSCWRCGRTNTQRDSPSFHTEIFHWNILHTIGNLLFAKRQFIWVDSCSLNPVSFLLITKLIDQQIQSWLACLHRKTNNASHCIPHIHLLEITSTQVIHFPSKISSLDPPLLRRENCVTWSLGENLFLALFFRSQEIFFFSVQIFLAFSFRYQIFYIIIACTLVLHWFTG